MLYDDTEEDGSYEEADERDDRDNGVQGDFPEKLEFRIWYPGFVFRKFQFLIFISQLEGPFCTCPFSLLLNVSLLTGKRLGNPGNGLRKRSVFMVTR